MPSNEGKACDAVLRELETRLGASRNNLIFPAEPAFPSDEQVEMIGFVGAHKFALEHTYVEPFKGYRDLEHQVGPFKRKLLCRLHGLIDPSASFDLTIPVDCLNNLRPREIEQLLADLSSWIARTVPNLTHDPDDRAPAIFRQATPDIPFDVFLRRRDLMNFPPRFEIYSLVPPKTEKLRRARLRAAYRRKAAKLLAVKRKHDTRTILILEEDDIQGTNQYLLAEAVRRIEKGYLAERPDEVHLLLTAMRTWYLYPIRIDGRWPYDKGEPRGRYRELDSAQLSDITDIGRSQHKRAMEMSAAS